MVALLKQYGTDKMVVNSAADWGRSDPLKVPKTGACMREHGFSDSDIEKVLFINPVTFYAQSGRISLDEMSPLTIDQQRLWEDNSVLRGQKPIIE
jgi:hypothetical protein